MEKSNYLENEQQASKSKLLKFQFAALIIGAFTLTFFIANRIEPLKVNSIMWILQGKMIITIIYFFVVRFVSAYLSYYIAKNKNRNIWSWVIFGFLLPPIALIILVFIRNKNGTTYIVKNSLLILLTSSLTTLFLYSLITNDLNNTPVYNSKKESFDNYRKVVYKNVSFDIPSNWTSSYEKIGNYNQVYCSGKSDDNYFLIIWTKDLKDKQEFLNEMKRNFQKKEPFNNFEFIYDDNDIFQIHKALSYKIKGSYLAKNYLGKMSVFTIENELYSYFYLSNESDYQNIDYPSIISSLNLENQKTNNIVKKKLNDSLDFYSNETETPILKTTKQNIIDLEAEKQFKIGYKYYTGHKVKQDYSLALYYFKKAAKNNNPDAECFIGLMYNNGYGVQKDENSAFHWYKKAAKNGNKEAQYNLAQMYMEGHVTTKDSLRAFYWYKKSAEQGLDDAQYSLAQMYFWGNGIDRNYIKAFEWCKKSAEQGCGKAQLSLGQMYYNGFGTVKNLDLAYDWIYKSARQGIVEGEASLGVLYYNGEGVEKNYKEAAYWVKKAMNKGLNNAKTFWSVNELWKYE